MQFPPLWPPRAGDLFFLQYDASDPTDATWLNKEMLSIESGRELDGKATIIHVGIIITDAGDVLETTSGETTIDDLAKVYAGSLITIMRWDGMTPERAQAAYQAVQGQVGKPYPIGRLLTAWLGIPGHDAKSAAMECDVLAAFYEVGAGAKLQQDPWDYLPESLYRELLSSPSWKVVFTGSMRVAGLVTGSGQDNALVRA